ncbi:MAG: cytochrome c family protein [Nitrobacter sp.]|jgi:cytochrome c|nr:cytochrome c family protein [Nitrobacter sp.]OJV01872.1 MAG: cytochrome C [Nitrobacter sp. 62-23]
MTSGSDTVHSNRTNAILGALLGTLLFVQTVRIIDESFSAPEKPHAEASHKADVKEAAAAPAAAATDPAAFNKLLASASAERGAALVKQCQICHNTEEGKGPKIGPDLFGIVNRPVASVAGFNYSAALKAKGGKWTFAELDRWIEDPRTYVKGTSMSFAGLKSENKRADLIAYLNTLSKDPAPLPK